MSRKTELPRISLPSWVERLVVLMLALASLAVALENFADRTWWQGLVLLVISFSFLAMNWLMDATFEQGYMAGALEADRQFAGGTDQLERDSVLAHVGLNRPKTRHYGVDLTRMMHDIQDLGAPNLSEVAEQIRRHGERR